MNATGRPGHGTWTLPPEYPICGVDTQAVSERNPPSKVSCSVAIELDARQREQFDERARDARRAVRRGETVRARRILVELDRLGRTTGRKKTVSELERDLARAEQTELLRSSRRARWNGLHEEAKLTAEEALARLPEESPRALENVATAEIAADRRDRRIRRREAQPARFTPGTRDRHSLAAGSLTLDSRFILMDARARCLLSASSPRGTSTTGWRQGFAPNARCDSVFRGRAFRRRSSGSHCG